MKVANYIIAITLFVMVQVAAAQQPQQPQQQLAIGENTKLNAGGLFTVGYQGAYGDAIPSNHGMDFGFDGKVNGYYYNPNFISFTATPYYDQSRANSDYQSITGASGVAGTANFFTGSHFPGGFSYHYDKNSSGTLGLVGQPNFTTTGTGHGFGVNWSALLPDWPTLAVAYSQGSGHSNIYGTDQQNDSNTRLFNVHSNYTIAGFLLNAYFNHNTVNSTLPEFLSGEGQAAQESTGHDLGFGAQHKLPVHGSFSVSYDRASATSAYSMNLDPSASPNGTSSNNSSYTDNNETANANFHPSQKLSLNISQNFTDNLNGYESQILGSNGAPVPGLNLGSGSYSSTIGGGASYAFTNFLAGSAQATYYNQHYFGQSFSGEYLSGTLSYGKRLWDTFTFSGSVIDSSNGQGTNAVGFIGNVNAYRRFGHWITSGQFSYAQNVQTFLVTYTTSYYNYSGNVSRRLPGHIQWVGAFNGTRSGLTNDAGSNTRSDSYSSSLSMRRLSVNSFFSKSHGVSLLSAGGIITPTATPGLSNFILFSGSSYGGGISVTPVKRMTISGSFARAISNTLAATDSHNNTEIINAQLQYHLRRIGLDAGYTRFTQGISAIGAPINNTTFFVGMTRWFDFF
jgi:hypothetical protein